MLQAAAHLVARVPHVGQHTEHEHPATVTVLHQDGVKGMHNLRYPSCATTDVA